MWAALTSAAGGLGLFLLGMTMMSDGLRLVAGPALERILAAATRTRWHGLASGVLVTSMVQSSSAVTVAAIGFVNAGLLPLGAALWVLFGANVGTTMTGWIVALVGLKFKIEALALPLVGLGVALRLSGEGRRRGAVGTALAGFGLLFMGIALLQQAFAGLAGQIELPEGDGALAVAAQVGLGALMTVLMQSSSASMAIALTAAQQGLLTAQGAAAVVIGANVGTTVTAVLAVVGATSNARRAAMAHVLFNLLTGAVALVLLPWLIPALDAARRMLDLHDDPAARLALFHTVFNVMGVALMWPVAGRLHAWLAARFRAREEDEGQPRFLDDNVLAVPALAISALEQEVARIGEVAVRLARMALGGADALRVGPDQRVVAQLSGAADRFVARMARTAMTPATSERLAIVLRLLRYHQTTASTAAQAAPVRPLADRDVQVPHRLFVGGADRLLGLCEPHGVPWDADALNGVAGEVEAAYQQLKAAVLRAGADGRVPLSDMDDALGRLSLMRRAVQQAVKARLLGASRAGASDGATV